jgi:hypothetical protein
MTTGFDHGNQADPAEVWRRAIGRLEGYTTALLEGQGEIKAALDAGLREANRHIDRLFYAILAVGGALFVAVFASRFIGG